MSFKNKHSFANRCEEAQKIKEKYPDRIPVICEVDPNNKNVIQLKKMKYLVPEGLTVGQFIYILRKQMTLKPEESVFLLVNEILPPTSALLSHIYNDHKDIDGFLYCFLCKENTFGGLSS